MTNNLIREVAKIDRKAAIFMQRRLPLLRVRKLIVLKTLPSNSLNSCFLFAKTPQGFNYWNNICDQLPEPYGW
jgi:hypothetical protein